MDEIETTMAIKSAVNNTANIKDNATREVLLEILGILTGLQIQIVDMQSVEEDDE